MGKLNCICGQQISNVQSPSSNNGYLLRDIDLEREDEFNVLAVIEMGRDVWECFSCGRIAIGNNKDNTVKWYKPEDEKPGNLMAFDND